MHNMYYASDISLAIFITQPPHTQYIKKMRTESARIKKKNIMQHRLGLIEWAEQYWHIHCRANEHEQNRDHFSSSRVRMRDL